MEAELEPAPRAAAGAPPVYMPLSAVAEQMGTRDDHLLPYIRRREDPLPVRYLAGKKRGGFVIVAELNEWINRNTVGWADRDKARAR